MNSKLKKVIIAIVGSANTGKSSAITQLAIKFPTLKEMPEFSKRKENDDDTVCYGKYLNYENQESTLGICSFGDNKSMLEDYFFPLIEKYSCNVIVVACHNYRETDGNTFYYIREVAKKYGYRLITTSILRDDAIDDMNDEEKKSNEVIHVLNDIFAENMSNLIKSIA